MTAWLEHAACHGMNPNMFFDSRVNPAAVAACQRCPVIDECLTDSLRLDGLEQYGYRAGRTAEERWALALDRGAARRPTATVCGTDSGYTRHRRTGEPTCTACRAAHSEAQRARDTRRAQRTA